MRLHQVLLKQSIAVGGPMTAETSSRRVSAFCARSCSIMGAIYCAISGGSVGVERFHLVADVLCLSTRGGTRGHPKANF